MAKYFFNLKKIGMINNYYERHLPHWHPPGATFFLTYRLYGSLPVQTIQAIQAITEQELKVLEKYAKNESILLAERYKIQNRYFKRYDDALDQNLNAPYWLKQTEIAQIVYDSWIFLSKEDVNLHAFTIMSNHVHVLLTHIPEKNSISKLLQRHKGFTGNQCLKVLGQHGAFWQEETYDHVVRKTGEFQRIVRYILNNPAKAGLVNQWSQWPWTYLSDKLDPGAWK